MRWLAVVFLALSLASCATDQPVKQPVGVESQSAEKAYREERRLRLAGFEPLEMLTAKGLEVQRVDPMWDLLDYPTVELVRSHDGKVAIFLRYLGREQKGSVNTDEWNRLALMTPGAFTPVTDKAISKHLKNSYCHAWHDVEASFAGKTMTARVSPCSGELQKAGLAYAEALFRLAIDSIGMCESERANPDSKRALWDCGRKFAPPTEQYKTFYNSRR